MIYTKAGDTVTDLWIDHECYYREKLIQIHGTVEGKIRLLYLSDLKADDKKEIHHVVKAALRNPGAPSTK